MNPETPSILQIILCYEGNLFFIYEYPELEQGGGAEL